MNNAKKKSEEIKINMKVELEAQCYICPECGHIVTWIKEEAPIRPS